jgi:hypothetical protein
MLLAGCSRESAPPGGESVANEAPAAKTPPALSVTALDPTTGDPGGGTYVRVMGAGFLAGGPHPLKLYFGSRQGTVVRVARDGELIVQAPGGKAGETVDVLFVFEPGGEVRLRRAFTYVARPPAP